MARDGSRGYERAENDLARLLRRQREARRLASVTTLAQVGQADRRPLLPLPPTAMNYVPVRIIGPDGEARDTMRAETIELNAYEFASAVRFTVKELSELEALPRLLCKRTGLTIGIVAPAQWHTMQMIWPSLTIEQAEAMLAVTGAIAPQSLFNHPQALQALAGLDPVSAGILCLEMSLRANWSAARKGKMQATWTAEAAEPDCDELPLMIYELALDCARLHADWATLECNRQFVSTIMENISLGDVLEALKDAGHATARYCVQNKAGLLRLSPEKRQDLLSRHGASYARATAPVLGEAGLVRRAISLYCRDYTFLLQRVSDDELLCIVGSAHNFHEAMQRRYSQGKSGKHQGLDRFAAAMQKRMIDEDFAAMLLDTLDKEGDNARAEAEAEALAKAMQVAQERMDRAKALHQANLDKLALIRARRDERLAAEAATNRA